MQDALLTLGRHCDHQLRIAREEYAFRNQVIAYRCSEVTDPVVWTHYLD